MRTDDELEAALFAQPAWSTTGRWRTKPGPLAMATPGISLEVD
jgi:hypothetical protein